jgi:hypothetical protein
VAAAETVDRAAEIIKRFGNVEVIAMGGGAGHKPILKALTAANVSIPIKLVHELNTTMEARKKYFKENPPRGFLRLLPAGLRVPPRPVDDYAAVAIGELFLRGEEKQS